MGFVHAMMVLAFSHPCTSCDSHAHAGDLHSVSASDFYICPIVITAHFVLIDFVRDASFFFDTVCNTCKIQKSHRVSPALIVEHCPVALEKE